MKRIIWCVAVIFLFGGCAEYPNGAVVKREKVLVFTNFGLRLPGFRLTEDGVHEYRFKRVRFHDGKAGIRFHLTLHSSEVEFETLDAIATVEIWEVGNVDSLVYRQSGPLNDILSEGQPAWWPDAYDRQSPRTHFAGHEGFTAFHMAHLSGWKEYRLKVVVTNLATSDALERATASVELVSTSK